MAAQPEQRLRGGWGWSLLAAFLGIVAILGADSMHLAASSRALPDAAQFLGWFGASVLGALVIAGVAPRTRWAVAIPVLLIFGILVALLGWGLGIWTIYLFKTIGQGTPNPTLPPKQLVTSGPYAYIRNPMALGGFYLLLGEAALYASPSLVGIATLYLVILYCYARWVEEPILVRRFGKPYHKYLQQVPRFFPNPFRRK